MKLTTSSWIYEKYDLKTLNDNDLEVFWRIIQETWSYYFKEYMNCNSCDTEYSKKDIYKDKDKDYRNSTIQELEKKFWTPTKCNSCESDLSHIWWEDYLPSLEKSLTNNVHTTLVTCKNQTNQIIWLTYANVDRLANIYDNDLSYDFNQNDFSSTALDNRLDENFLLTTGLSLIERETDKQKAYELLAFLHKSIPNKYQKIPWIIATIYRTPIYKLYQQLWARDFNLMSTSKQNVRLMYAENIADTFNKKLSFILD
jgi:hypothetical protein